MPGMPVSTMCRNTELAQAVPYKYRMMETMLAPYSIVSQSPHASQQAIYHQVLKNKQASFNPLSTYSVMGFKASRMLPSYPKNRGISHMTTRRNTVKLQTSFTLMAASRTSAALGTGCEGRDSIGRGKARLTRGQRWPHLKDTRKLVR